MQPNLTYRVTIKYVRNIARDMAEDLYSDFTPEDVSSLMRIEKASGQLSEVRRDLYPAMLALQERIAREIEKKDVESLDHDLLVDRKKKLISNIKLVVEFRMNKVAAMALRGAMGTLNVVDSLPPEERKFYDEVLESAKVLWNSPHKKKKTVHIPEIIPDETEVVPVPEPAVQEPVGDVSELGAEDIPVIPDEGPTEMVGPDDVPFPDEPGAADDIPPIPEEELAAIPMPPAEVPEEPAAEEEDENPDAECFDTVTVRMIESVEPFAGTERNYSLKKEDVVRLPKSLATILVSRNLAVILNI